MTETPIAGHRVVVRIYLIIVVLAGVMGYVLGVISPAALEPRLFGLFVLPPTPLGVAIYGALTVATGLGVLLLGVIYVSERFDAEQAS
ncbi:MAG: cox cluster protein [Haloarculaceae archaeon]